MVEIKNIRKVYGDITALDVPELSIKKGEHLGLVGNNGAGKTTLFSLALDLIQPSSGSISLQGVEVAKSEAWKKNCSAFIDDHFLIDYLTPEEYFGFVAHLRRVKPAALAEFFDQFKGFFNEEV